MSQPQKKTSLLRRLIDHMNPRYHLTRFKEDMAATKSALQKRKDLLNGNADHASLPEIFRGKLMGVFFATGWTNLVGIALGVAAQKASSNQYVGLFATPVFCYFVTAIGFQVGWWLDNRRIYQQVHADPAHRFWSLQQDMLPVHKASLPFAVAFNVANLVISGPILVLISWINPTVGRETPAGILIIVVEFLFVGSQFVRVMGDFFDKYSYKLATKYKVICQETAN